MKTLTHRLPAANFRYLRKYTLGKLGMVSEGELPPANPEKRKNKVLQLARSFAERVGTWVIGRPTLTVATWLLIAAMLQSCEKTELPPENPQLHKIDKMIVVQDTVDFDIPPFPAVVDGDTIHYGAILQDLHYRVTGEHGGKTDTVLQGEPVYKGHFTRKVNGSLVPMEAVRDSIASEPASNYAEGAVRNAIQNLADSGRLPVGIRELDYNTLSLTDSVVEVTPKYGDLYYLSVHNCGQFMARMADVWRREFGTTKDGTDITQMLQHDIIRLPIGIESGRWYFQALVDGGDKYLSVDAGSRYAGLTQ